MLRGETDPSQRASRRAEALIEEQDRAMEPTRTGGCLCGGVRYEVHGSLRPVVACHCTQCRKTSGHYVAATDCAASDIKIVETTLKWFKSSDVAERGFCSRCGSNLFWRRFGKPKISIWAGTLDGQTGLRLAFQIHAESKGDYYDLPPVPVIDQADLDQELS